MVLEPGTPVREIQQTEAQETRFMVRWNFLCPILQVLMGEECSGEEFDYQGSSPVGGPSVITFQDPRKKPEVSASDRVLKKAFMVRNPRYAPIHSAQLSPTSVFENLQTPARTLKSNEQNKIW